MKREPRKGVEAELLSVSEVGRALKRCESEVQQLRVINAALAIVKDTRGVRSSITADSKRAITWEVLS
jgi:hypothetical protein